MKPGKQSGRVPLQLSEATPNPSIDEGDSSGWGRITNGNGNSNGNGNGKSKSLSRRYFATVDDTGHWPPELHLYNQRFAQTLNKIKRRHDSVVTTMAQGILEYKRRRQRMQIDSSIQSFLDRFYMSRIGIRMLIGQHIALTDQSHHRDPTYVGIICTKTNVRDLAEEAIENARFVCEDHYGLFEAPRIQLVCNPNINFMYVPGHLSHMLFETLKNSLRAVVETHGMDKQEFPVTKVIVAEGREDITIKISDEGGGIPRSAIPLVWTYMYTTVDRTPNLDPDFDKSDFKAPMAGFGYGLPISRLYARYFGGDLKLISMEGYVQTHLRPTSPPSFHNLYPHNLVHSFANITLQIRHRCLPPPQPSLLVLRTSPIAITHRRSDRPPPDPSQTPQGPVGGIGAEAGWRRRGGGERAPGPQPQPPQRGLNKPRKGDEGEVLACKPSRPSRARPADPGDCPKWNYNLYWIEMLVGLTLHQGYTHSLMFGSTQKKTTSELQQDRGSIKSPRT
jgi:pyruvate dehydrogenase kinase 2/3/4